MVSNISIVCMYTIYIYIIPHCINFSLLYTHFMIRFYTPLLIYCIYIMHSYMPYSICIHTINIYYLIHIHSYTRAGKPEDPKDPSIHIRLLPRT